MKLSFLATFIFLLASMGSAFGLEDPSGETPSDWTVMVFLNADNNLHNAGLDDLSEMQRIGSTEQVNVVVQFDGRELGDSRRYFVEKGNLRTEETFEDRDNEVDMGDWRNLVEFANWAIQTYPAKKYLISVWDHGSGWLKYLEGQEPILLQEGISYDDESGNHMSTPDLGMAMAEISEALGRKIDVYGSDACNMGMIEVAYELYPYTDVVVGAESTEPFDGWPYDDFLRYLVRNSEANAEQVGRALVQTYGISYRGGSQGRANTTLAAMRTRLFSDFLEQSDVLFTQLIDRLPKHKEAILDAAEEAVRYEFKDNMDLADFFKRLAKGMKDDPVFPEIVPIWLDLYERQLLIESTVAGSKFRGSTGLAIWFPTYAYKYLSLKADYMELNYANESSWVEFLQAFHFEEDALAFASTSSD